MRKVLLAGHPTTGHTNALRAIGARLLGQGHKVAMAIVAVRLPFADRLPEPIRDAVSLSQDIAKVGLDVLPLAAAPESLLYAFRLPSAQGQTELELALKLFTAGMEPQARRIAQYAQSWQADIIVGDYSMPAAMLGAQLAGRPYVALYHSALPFPVKDAPPFGSGLIGTSPGSRAWLEAEDRANQLVEFFDHRVARSAKALGLTCDRTSLLTRPISQDLNLLATAPELEPDLLPLQGPVAMIGPCLPPANNSDPNHPVFAALKPGQIHVYVSLGTVFNGQPWVYETILDGLATLDIQVIVSAGASFDKLVRRGNTRTHLFRRVPQVALLPTVDLVVTHGGNNTVQETLAAGKPMVVVPFGGDQVANALRVERLGVGVSVPPSKLDADAIRRAVETAREPAMMERAQALGDALRHYDGAQTAASMIAGLASPRSTATPKP